MTCPVTAVITTHRRPDQLVSAIDSVLGEVFQDFELIIVEDGRALERGPIESLRPRTRLIQGDGLGVAGARNAALAAAAGEFIIYLDDDDVALPRRIDTLLAQVRANDVDLCFGLTRRTNLEGPALVPTHHRLPGPVTLIDLMTCTPHVNSVLVRTDALRGIGGFDPVCRHLDDWAAWLRLADEGMAMWGVDVVVAEWRVQSSGLTAQVYGAGQMKERIAGLCDHLAKTMSPEGKRVIAMARGVLRERSIQTYDDYADAMQRHRGEAEAGDGWPARIACPSPGELN